MMFHRRKKSLLLEANVRDELDKGFGDRRLMGSKHNSNRFVAAQNPLLGYHGTPQRPQPHSRERYTHRLQNPMIRPYPYQRLLLHYSGPKARTWAYRALKRIGKST